MPRSGDGGLGTHRNHFVKRRFDPSEILTQKRLNVAQTALDEIPCLASHGAILQGFYGSTELKRHDFGWFRFFQRFLKLCWRPSPRSNRCVGMGADS